MGQQNFNFERVESMTINPEPPRRELTNRNLKLEKDDDEWLNQIANAKSEAMGDNRYGASSVGREAVAFYRSFYAVHRKASFYRDAIVNLLNSLPEPPRDV